MPAREKFPRGIARGPRLCSFAAMPFRLNLANCLRGAALALLVGGMGVWLATGAHLGFTQTSMVTMKRDEITGIDYPERRPGFVAGIEFPLGTAGAAIVLALLSLAADRRNPAA
jgi:hypothetical protein